MSATAFYNENDPKAAAWLRELIKEGRIADGVVDERSITEIQPNELEGYAQCHFFAGIGGWSLALRLAGVPDGFRVWTGSCPCQPFSSAGKQLGTEDERHLWPAFFRLIRECGPELIFGEQVASAAVLGGVSKSAQRKAAASAVPVWLDGVFADLESAQYTCAAADIPAAGVGAPHIRQRLYWVADSEHAQRRPVDGPEQNERHRKDGGWQETHCLSRACSVVRYSGVAIAHGREPWYVRVQRSREHGQQPEDDGARGLADSADVRGSKQWSESREGSRRSAGPADAAECAGPCGLGNSASDDQRRDSMPGEHGQGKQAGRSGGARWMGEPIQPGLEGYARDGNHGHQSGRLHAIEAGPVAAPGGAWDSFDILPCLDGKARRIESGSFPLAHGVPGRVGLLRGYGNAIVPQVAAEFVISALESITANE